MLASRNLRLLLALVCTAILVPVARGHAFPLNGGLDRSYRGTPFGWEETGGWAPLPIGSHEGRAHFILREHFAEAGDELRSRSFRLISPGDPLTVRCAYQSSAEGASIGLVFCDDLGEPVGERWGCELPPADEWTEFETELQMDTRTVPDNAAGVKVSVLVETEDIEVQVDAIELEGPACAPMDPERSAPTPTSPWQPEDLLEPVSAEVAIEADLCEPGAEQPVSEMWLSSPLTVHGTYPHRALATVELAGDPGAEATLILRAVGDDAAEVLWQEATPIPSDGDEPISVGIPALYIASQYVDLQVGLAISSTGPASARVKDLELLAVPFSVELHGVQRKSSFESPDGAEVFVSAVNNVGAEVTTEAMLTVTDEDGNTVHREQRTIRIRGRSAASFSVKPRLSAPGDYVFDARFMLGAAEIDSEEFEFTVQGGA